MCHSAACIGDVFSRCDPNGFTWRREMPLKGLKGRGVLQVNCKFDCQDGYTKNMRPPAGALLYGRFRTDANDSRLYRCYFSVKTTALVPEVLLK